MPKCASCGLDNLAQAKFCKQCGTVLGATATDLDAAELLARLQSAKAEAERRVPELQAELDARGRELSAAIEKGAALERELAAAKVAQPTAAEGAKPAESVKHEIQETLHKLRIEKDDMTGALAAATARIKDLEHRLGTDLSKVDLTKVKAVVARRKWLTPTLSAALALVMGFAGFDHWSGNNAQSESTRQTQLLANALDAAKKTVAGLQQEVETLRKSPPPGPSPALGVDPKAAAALAARENAVRDAEDKNTKRAAELDAQARKLKDSQPQLAGAAPRVAANPAAPFGFLLWQGRVQAATDIFITGSQVAGGGVVSGTLPGRKCEVRDETIDARTRIMPGPNNNWNQAVISPESGRVATVLFVWTCPGR